MTGTAALSNELSGKQLGLLHDLVPKAATIAVLFDPSLLPSGEITLRDVRDAAAVLGQKLLVLEASTAEEIDAQFARLDQGSAVRFFSLGRGRSRRLRSAMASPQSTHSASMPKPAAS